MNIRAKMSASSLRVQAVDEAVIKSEVRHRGMRRYRGPLLAQPTDTAGPRKGTARSSERERKRESKSAARRRALRGFTGNLDKLSGAARESKMKELATRRRVKTGTESHLRILRAVGPKRCSEFASMVAKFKRTGAIPAEGYEYVNEQLAKSQDYDRRAARAMISMISSPPKQRDFAGVQVEKKLLEGGIEPHPGPKGKKQIIPFPDCRHQGCRKVQFRAVYVKKLDMTLCAACNAPLLSDLHPRATDPIELQYVVSACEGTKLHVDFGSKLVRLKKTRRKVSKRDGETRSPSRGKPPAGGSAASSSHASSVKSESGPAVSTVKPVAEPKAFGPPAKQGRPDSAPLHGHVLDGKQLLAAAGVAYTRDWWKWAVKVENFFFTKILLKVTQSERTLRNALEDRVVTSRGVDRVEADLSVIDCSVIMGNRISWRGAASLLGAAGMAYGLMSLGGTRTYRVRPSRWTDLLGRGPTAESRLCWGALGWLLKGIWVLGTLIPMAPPIPLEEVKLQYVPHMVSAVASQYGWRTDLSTVEQTVLARLQRLPSVPVPDVEHLPCMWGTALAVKAVVTDVRYFH